MADEVEIAKNSVAVLSKVFVAGTTFSAVSSILSVSKPLSAAFAVLGAILALFAGLLPDVKHQEILRRFDELSHKIDLVRSDIRELGKMIQWEFTELKYGRDVAHIELGIEYCIEIGRRIGKEEKKWYQDKLKDHCASGNCAFAMRHLMDGMIGNGILGSSSILERFYNYTGGDRPRISALASRLLKVVYGGMMVISTYDTMMLGEKGAADVTKPFYRRLNETCNKVKSVLDKCIKHFRVNMLNDLNKFLDRGGSNRDLGRELRNFTSEKYDWLENVCLVYKDMYGSYKHHFSGDRVDSLHRNGKCGIIFYRNKDIFSRYSERFNETHESINDDSWCGYSAERCYRKILSKMKEKHIGWSGCAVIRRGSDQYFGGMISNRDVCVVGKVLTKILLLK